MIGDDIMACYHPLTGYKLGTNPKTGKEIIKVVGQDFNGEEFSVNGYEKIAIPCGKCKGCRLEYSRQWAMRCMLELQAHDKACFLTLTYNDEHLPPVNSYVDDQGIERSSPIHPLRYDDVQKFLKKLRQVYYPWKIRFFMCGEYGPKHLRPHYHLILFGIDLKEFDAYIEYSSSTAGDKKTVNRTYTSSIVDALWRDVKPHEKSNPEVYMDARRSLGFHSVGSVTYESCAYVARYIFKKQLGKGASVYTDLHYPSEFCNMSRRPGIGRVYYDLCKEDIYKTEEIFIKTATGGKKFKPPRYYDRLYDIDYPEDMEAIKIRRHELAVAKNKLRSSQSSKSYNDQLLTDEEVLSARLDKITRKEL